MGGVSYSPVMPYVNPIMKEHVTALVATLPGDSEPTFQGTGFFVQVTNSTGLIFDYLITAKHVEEILARAGGDVAMRLNVGQVGQFNLGTKDIPIPTKGWLHHEDPKVDLAALCLGAVLDRPASGKDVVRMLKLYLDRVTATRPPKMMWPPGEGEDVLFVAMTSQFRGVRANLPLVRKGSIALVTDEPIKGKYGYSEYYVVQAQVYPGNSGAPIWVYYDSTNLVNLGVLVFSYPVDEEITKAIRGDVDIDIRRNYGLALVVPIEKVIEMVDRKDEVARREAKRGPHLSGEAVAGRGSEQGEEVVMTAEAFRRALRRVSRPDGKEVIQRQDEASSQ